MSRPRASREERSKGSQRPLFLGSSFLPSASEASSASEVIRNHDTSSSGWKSPNVQIGSEICDQPRPEVCEGCPRKNPAVVNTVRLVTRSSTFQTGLVRCESSTVLCPAHLTAPHITQALDTSQQVRDTLEELWCGPEQRHQPPNISVLPKFFSTPQPAPAMCSVL